MNENEIPEDEVVDIEPFEGEPDFSCAQSADGGLQDDAEEVQDA